MTQIESRLFISSFGAHGRASARKMEGALQLRDAPSCACWALDVIAQSFPVSAHIIDLSNMQRPSRVNTLRRTLYSSHIFSWVNKQGVPWWTDTITECFLASKHLSSTFPFFRRIGIRPDRRCDADSQGISWRIGLLGNCYLLALPTKVDAMKHMSLYVRNVLSSRIQYPTLKLKIKKSSQSFFFQRVYVKRWGIELRFITWQK